MGIGVCYMNNGIVFNDYAKIADSIGVKNSRFKKAIDNFKIINDERSIADCNLNIAILYYDLYLNNNNRNLTTDEYKLINKYLISAYNQYQASDDIYGIAMTLKNLSTINIDYSKTQKNKRAYLNTSINYAKESLNYADKLNALFLKYDAYFSLYKAYKHINITDTALIYHELYLVTEDSVIDAKKTEAIQEIETKYETEKKNVRIKELKIQNIKSENSKQIYLILATFLLIASITLFVFFQTKI